MMLNSHGNSAVQQSPMDASLAAMSYIECYLENTDNMPSEIQRFVTLLREMEFQIREVISKLATEATTYKSSDDGIVKKQSLAQIKKLLIKQKELGDKKLVMLSKIYELIENKSRLLDESLLGLEDQHSQANFIKNEDKNVFSSIPLTPSTSMTASFTNVASYSKVLNEFNYNNNNSSSSNNNNNNNNNANNNLTSSSSTRSSTNNNNNNNNNNSRLDDKQDSSKLKRHRRLRGSNANQESSSFINATKDIEKMDEEDKPRKKKSRRDKIIEKTPSINNSGSNNNNNSNNNHHSAIKIIGNIDPNEPVYCLCREVSYGEMIGCDNEGCEIEWFHFHCVNLSHKPKGKWFCPTCRGDRQNVLNPELVEQRKAKKNAVLAIAAAAANNSNNASD